MENALDDFENKTILFAQSLGCEYCDVRTEIISKQGFEIENGEIEYFATKDEQGVGVRLLNNGSWGFYSITNPTSFDEIKNGVEQAAKAAKYSSTNKKTKVKLAWNPVSTDRIDYPVKKDSSIDELKKIGFDCDYAMKQNPRIIKTNTSIGVIKTKKFFTSSEGARINQNYTDTIADLAATVHESGLTEAVNITEGGRGGIEKLFDENDVISTAGDIASKASQLIDAKPAKETKGTVVMNPDFVGLLTHEILGHPSEADRVLGKEMAWAGGAWWAGKLGESIGSSSLNVFDDPTIPGSLGWYKYDDEGVESRPTSLIENGVLKNHFQSRETAEEFGVLSTANMRATSYKFMPLIRMSCTCIEPGNWNQSEMISEVKEGIMISNMKIPSIDMKRYNWSISCQYAQKIENGELTDLLRDVIVLGTAPEFFASIDACGNDFRVRPITNCGKGDPMQSMIMGNGGPSIRAEATVKSVGA